MSKLPQQLVPLLVMVAFILGGLIAARALLVPDSFGEYGHYRADATIENAACDMVYAGAQVCGECHDDIYETKTTSHHRGVACEACHGPALAHTEAPDEFTPSIPRGRGHCPLCHGYNPARPTGFPQILPELHNPGQACIGCHDPHHPQLPRTPEDCAACHREIASQKMVSHHSTLPCTQCHVVPEGHKTSPRFIRAEKPQTPELCGQCHARGADSPRSIPRVDVDTHGGRYFCWDCHYPHFPEATQ